MQSAIFEGHVRHRRYQPVPHAFHYRLFMVYLDLAELDTVFRGRWLWSTRRRAPAWLRRDDHLGDPAVPLDTAIRDLVAARTGQRPAGPIRLLTHLRYFGYCFNPVSFYYCFDAAGERVETLVADVSNTPWGERHAYVLDASQNLGHGTRLRYRFGKDFHVSPFMPMEQRYDWRLTRPGRQLGIHMENWQSGRRVFDATLRLERREISAGALASALVRYPLMTATIIGAIYWQALRLKLKGIPFHVHPKSRPRVLKEPVS